MLCVSASGAVIENLIPSPSYPGESVGRAVEKFRDITRQCESERLMEAKKVPWEDLDAAKERSVLSDFEKDCVYLLHELLQAQEEGTANRRARKGQRRNRPRRNVETLLRIPLNH
jgi:hypothetical protein